MKGRYREIKDFWEVLKIQNFIKRHKRNTKWMKYIRLIEKTQFDMFVLQKVICKCNYRLKSVKIPIGFY